MLSEAFVCPICNSALTESGRAWSCAKGHPFPTVSRIPVLFEDPEAFLGEWRLNARLQLQTYDHQVTAIKTDLAAKPSALTEKRLRALMQATVEQKKQMQKVLQPLGNWDQETPIALSRALGAKLPFTQSLSSYFHNLHRDWGWGDIEENRVSAEIVGGALRDVPCQSLLVVGAGAARLSYDLHRLKTPALTCALDINPLLSLCAQRIVDGRNVTMWEFPIAPLSIEDSAVETKLNAPVAIKDGFEFVLADGLRAPIKKGAFDTVLTPWFIDIVPADFTYVCQAINSYLGVGGAWCNFGSIFFHGQSPRRHYSIEEAREIVAASGFRLVEDSVNRIPYLESPHSGHSRREQVWTFVAIKEREMPPPAKFELLPSFLRNPDEPIPFTAQIQNFCLQQKVGAHLAGLIDGKRSVNQVAELIQAQLGLPFDEAKASLSRMLARLIERELLQTDLTSG